MENGNERWEGEEGGRWSNKIATPNAFLHLPTELLYPTTELLHSSAELLRSSAELLQSSLN